MVCLHSAIVAHIGRAYPVFFFTISRMLSWWVVIISSSQAPISPHAPHFVRYKGSPVPIYTYSWVKSRVDY